MTKKLMARIDGPKDPFVEQTLTNFGIEFHYVEIGSCPKCKHISCVCEILTAHKKGCSFRLASTCAIPIECDHGFDVCPTCDPCTCKETV